MAETEDKWVEAVAKLIKLTQASKIKWSSSKPPDYLKGDADDYVETIFLAKYNDRNLRLYQRIYKIEFNPLTGSGLFKFGDPRPDYLWSSNVALEMLDLDGNKIWKFPQVTPLEDLLTSVRFQVADLDGFIEKLLKDAED